MKLSRAVDIKIELQGNIRSLFSRARSSHYTSTQLNEAYHKLFERYPKDLPQWVKSYAQGAREAYTATLYQYDLTHGYVWQEKVFCKWDDYPEDLKEHIRKTPTDNLECGHFWKSSLEKDHKERRPFFVHVAI